MNILENDALLELIACSELKPRQIIRTEKGGYVVPIYRFLRIPTSIKELEPYNNSTGTFVSMSNGTLVLLSNGDISGKYVLNKLKKFLSLSSCLSVEMYADSDDAIVETAVFFGTLKSSEEAFITFNTEVIFDAARSEQLSLVFEAASSKHVSFYRSRLNEALSTMLATRPYPMKLELRFSSMDCNAFLETLQSRTTSFGSLTLDFANFREGDIRRLCNHLDLFEHLKLEYLPSDHIATVLSSSIKSISFSVSDEVQAIDFEAAGIVPKHIEIAVHSDPFPTEFLLSFFQQVTRSGHLENLKLSLIGDYISIPTAVKGAFIAAVAANRNLRRLELNDGEFYELNSCMDDLFAVLETHEGLRILQIDSVPERFDSTFAGLERLLKRNRYIEVWNCWEETLNLDICVMNRVFRESKSILREAPSMRISLFGAALTRCSAFDFQRTGLWLSDHTDVLCDLLQEKLPAGEGGSIATNGMDGRNLSRKRKADS